MNNIAGYLLIDKPQGFTSHDVVALIRKKLQIKKVGHAGTLDPLATGLLIILLGREYTKKQAEFMSSQKEYLVTGRLGYVSDSYDLGSNLKLVKNFSKLDSRVLKINLVNLLNKYLGEVKQTVPAFSAVKIRGKKLYEQARKNKINYDNLPSRLVNFYELNLINFIVKDNLIEFELQVKCSAGTYIRSLIHDLGQDLGCGAVVTKLCRIKSGKFAVKQAINFHKDINSEELISAIRK